VTWGVYSRDDNEGRPGPFRPGPDKARTTCAGPPRLAHFMWVANTGSPRLALGPRARGLTHIFLIFMIKLSMFKDWETLRSSQN